MRGKTWKLAAVTLGLSISAAAAVYAQTPGWSLTGEGWRYMSVEGQYQAARWFQDGAGIILTRVESCRPDGFRMAAACGISWQQTQER